MEFTHLIDLASERLGGAVLEANDEFFAEKENLIRDAAPVWREGEYTDRGKWMDGWETRRRREPGYDWAVAQLPGIVERMNIEEMVERKVLGFSTQRVEEMIRNVTQRELDLIVNLGYVLGAIIGTAMCGLGVLLERL